MFFRSKKVIKTVFPSFLPISFNFLHYFFFLLIAVLFARVVELVEFIVHVREVSWLVIHNKSTKCASVTLREIILNIYLNLCAPGRFICVGAH